MKNLSPGTPVNVINGPHEGRNGVVVGNSNHPPGITYVRVDATEAEPIPSTFTFTESELERDEP